MAVLFRVVQNFSGLFLDHTHDWPIKLEMRPMCTANDQMSVVATARLTILDRLVLIIQTGDLNFASVDHISPVSRQKATYQDLTIFFNNFEPSLGQLS